MSEKHMPAVLQKRNTLGTKVYAAAGVALLTLMLTVRFASASFDEATVPLGDATAQDAMVSGTVRMLGEHFVFYNGSRLDSLSKEVAVRFSRGGSLVLCPYSRLQILTANQQAGIMLAFQLGGTERPFPVHPKDVIMTPDWRIELAGEVEDGDVGVLRMFSSRHGDLCVEGDTQPGAVFRVSQVAGDASFDLPSAGKARFSEGKMQPLTTGCSCEVSSENTASSTSASLTYNGAEQVYMASSGAGQSAGANDRAVAQPASPKPAENDAPAPQSAAVQKKQRPQDVAGYVKAFVHLMFGR